MEDIKELLPDEKIVVGSEAVNLRPFTFGQLPELIRIFNEGRSEFLLALNKVKVTNGDIVFNDGAVDSVCVLLASQWESISELMCMSTGKDQKWVSNLRFDEGVEILIKTIKINWSFFKERLLPMLRTLAVVAEVKEKVRKQKTN
ncbi:MAG: hypothetical protein E6713_07665 [Sporomusaceae bacterium]|nr:hypothetical protein [Sporomusaceae bacterium]